MTSKEIGGNITSETLVQLPSVNGNFIGFIGLLPGIVPSISTESFGSDCDQRQRPGPAQQQLHRRRRQQQRRRHRAARRDAGADADRGDPGVPGHHQPVRRRVRPDVRRRGQRGDEVGHQRRSTAARFGFFQDGSLTTKDFLGKAARSREGRHAAISAGAGQSAGRIVKDKIQYFASLERFSIDRAEHHRHPRAARSERPADDAGSRVEHDHPRRPSDQREQHLQRPLAARDVAADQPDHPDGDAGGDGTGSARGIGRRPDAGDQPELGAVEHEGQHAAPHVDARERGVRERVLQRQRPRPARKCEPTLSFQNFIDQQDNTGQSRINDGIQLDDTMAWFIPNKHGDHDLKVGGQYQLLGRGEQQPGRPERHVRVRPQRRGVQLGRSRGPTRIGSRFASAARAASSRRRTTSPRSRRTSGGSPRA